MKNSYDIIIIGGGHAGIEAAVAGARLGCRTALLTFERTAIGRMSCNPAIGGTAKGHLVREIDALGGVMGLLADKTGIQFRILNRSRGPAVWSPRCQSDQELYSRAASELVCSVDGLDVIEDSAVEVVSDGKKICGVKTQKGKELECRALIVCSGTFLNGKLFTGLDQTVGGRRGEPAATGLTESICALGIESGRLKTGTPPRLHKDSIDFSVLEAHPGDEKPQPFSFRTDKEKFPFLPQVNCHIAYTHEGTHEILRSGFDESPLYTGMIKGVGPRYCPSIEDKIVRFADKSRHQLFLEPEGLSTDYIYVNGFPTSLPLQTQLDAIHSVRGLENAQMLLAGYAVEYDFFPPHQIDSTLESKKVEGLYFAGQVNGTSGYEEAAAQGLIAGINAVLKINSKEEFVLSRSQAYIGVLIDDLVTKSTVEPYRMFTSRAEHRLLLRHDNAARRLVSMGHGIGMVDDGMFSQICRVEEQIAAGLKVLAETNVKGADIKGFLETVGAKPVEGTMRANKIAKRQDIPFEDFVCFLNDNELADLSVLCDSPEVMAQTSADFRYEDYIVRQKELTSRMEREEHKRIPADFDYDAVKSFSLEGREIFNKYRPRSVGQASRIPGITPADISVLHIYLRKHSATKPDKDN